MKIKINETETYEISLENSSEIRLNELDFIIDRLIKIRKVFANEMPINKIKTAIEYKRTVKSNLKWTREFTIEVLKVLYNKNINKEEKNKIFLEKYGRNVKQMRWTVSQYIRKFNIQKTDYEIIYQNGTNN